MKYENVIYIRPVYESFATLDLDLALVGTNIKKGEIKLMWLKYGNLHIETIDGEHYLIPIDFSAEIDYKWPVKTEFLDEMGEIVLIEVGN